MCITPSVTQGERIKQLEIRGLGINPKFLPQRWPRLVRHRGAKQIFSELAGVGPGRESTKRKTFNEFGWMK